MYRVSNLHHDQESLAIFGINQDRVYLSGKPVYLVFLVLKYRFSMVGNVKLLSISIDNIYCQFKINKIQ